MFRKLISSARKSSQKKEIEERVETVLLSKVPFLEGANYNLITEIADAVESINLMKGETIFNEGDIGDSFFLVVAGSVSLVSKGEPIAELGTGGCFGEGALLTDEVRGATAVAAEDVTLFKLKREAFMNLQEKYLKVRFRLQELHEERRAEGIKSSIERNLLQNAPFLSGADSEIVNELAQLLERKKYSESEVLINEGQEGTTFFLVEEGICRIDKGGFQVAQLGPGACIGEGSLLSSRPCSATVTALTDTSCFVMRKAAFRKILTRYPVFAKKLRKIHEDRSE